MSPKKTVEGLLAGSAAALLAGVLVGAFRMIHALIWSRPRNDEAVADSPASNRRTRKGPRDPAAVD